MISLKLHNYLLRIKKGLTSYNAAYSIIWKEKQQNHQANRVTHFNARVSSYDKAKSVSKRRSRDTTNRRYLVSLSCFETFVLVLNHRLLSYPSV